MTATAADTLQEALILRSFGLSVFPVKDKRPRCRWKQYQRRRPTEAETEQLFRLPDIDGIAAITGPVSGGFLNRDFDIPEAYHRWAADHRDLAEIIPTVRTGRGFRVCARTVKPVYAKYADGELIGDSLHYVVLPPSRHPNGSLYQWLTGPPLGPSEFPILDPVKAGFVPPVIQFQTPEMGHKAFVGFSAEERRLSEREPDLSADIREAIYRTLPTGPGQRNGRLHQYARALRDLVPDTAPTGLLFDAVREWWRLAVPVIGTKDLDTTLKDFRRAWSGVRVPVSLSLPKLAMRRGAAVKADDQGERLKGVCVELARTTGGMFHLSARDAGEALGLSKSHAARLLKALVGSGFVRVVSAGRPARTRRYATVYRLGNDPQPAARASNDHC